jgi:hypothetical protein
MRLTHVIEVWSLRTGLCGCTLYRYHITITVPFWQITLVQLYNCEVPSSRPQWPSGLRRGSAADRLQEKRVRISPRTRMYVSWECVFSGRGLCVRLIPCPEESYRLSCVIVCDLKPSRMRAALAVAPKQEVTLKYTVPIHSARSWECTNPL